VVIIAFELSITTTDESGGMMVAMLTQARRVVSSELAMNSGKPYQWRHIAIKWDTDGRLAVESNVAEATEAKAAVRLFVRK
jgi:hypothetical protein